MILDNNPNIDAGELRARVFAVRTRAYRETIAGHLARPEVPVQRQPATPRRGAALRGIVRSIPVLGALAAWVLRRWRIASAPGLTARERVRAVPILGRALHIGWAALDAPRFRAETGTTLEFVRREVDRVARLEDNLRRQADALILLEQRLEALASRIPVHAATGQAVGEAPGQATDATVGDFYLAFEEHFRGRGESIRERQAPYLELVRRTIGQRAAPRCVDIGCGSGEWLQLLADYGIPAFGFDLDPATAQAAIRAGHNVRLGDGIAWIEAQPPGSVDVITAFQVIEHIPFERLVQLIDATYRALSPEGIAIFETPNPENLQVGACSFYYDPTHRHPIPPQVAEFLARRRGFAGVEVLRMNAYPESQRLPGEGELVDRLNQLLYGPQDYALVVRMRRA